MSTTSIQAAKTIVKKAAATQSAVTLIPQTKYDAIMRLDHILQESRTAIRQAAPMARAFITAAAMKALEEAITDEMLADILNLMDSPLGFKTDRRPGATKNVRKGDKWVEEKVEPYHKQTIKRCVIVALLAGANLSGNEFNILVGQTYFTKEFMQRAVLAFPGINHFRMEIGAPTKHGEKTAALDARASWKVGDEEFSLNCNKTESGDFRIIVNAYETSGIDQIRGLAESKLLRRVFKELTGIKSYDPDDDDQTDPALEGKLASPITIEHEGQGSGVRDQVSDKDGKTIVGRTDDVVDATSEVAQEANHDEQVFFFVDSCCVKIEETSSVDAAAKMFGECLKDLKEIGWEDRTKQFVTKQLQDRCPAAYARWKGMKK